MRLFGFWYKTSTFSNFSPLAFIWYQKQFIETLAIEIRSGVNSLFFIIGKDVIGHWFLDGTDVDVRLGSAHSLKVLTDCTEWHIPLIACVRGWALLLRTRLLARHLYYPFAAQKNKPTVGWGSSGTGDPLERVMRYVIKTIRHIFKCEQDAMKRSLLPENPIFSSINLCSG